MVRDRDRMKGALATCCDELVGIGRALFVRDRVRSLPTTVTRSVHLEVTPVEVSTLIQDLFTPEHVTS